MKKYAVLIGLTISMILFFIAMMIYPGGTYQNKRSIGFDWAKNYFSNLFETKALNEAHNPSVLWAYAGMFFYSISFAFFFVNMAEKLPEKKIGNFIKYIGLLTLPFTFLIITPLHGLMLTISSILFWTCIVFITVYVLKSRLLFFKFYCIICLCIFYYAVYIHASANWDILPIVQKINSVSSIVLILGLEYFTKKEDFAHIKTKKRGRIPRQ